MSFVGFSQSRVVESLTKSGECVLAVLTRSLGEFEGRRQKSTAPLIHCCHRKLRVAKTGCRGARISFEGGFDRRY